MHGQCPAKAHVLDQTHVLDHVLDVDFADAAAPLSDALLHEAHHRIANNLAMIGSMVRLQAQCIAGLGAALSAEDGRRLLLDAAARIDAVARHHRLLCNAAKSDASVSADYLRALCEDASAISGREHLSLDCRIELDQAALDQRLLPIGLIINEMIINAAKYARPQGEILRVQVWCRSAPDGTILLDIEDDGVGLPADFDPARDGGFGFRIMRAFASQLRARLQFEPGSAGLRARLIAPPLA